MLITESSIYIYVCVHCTILSALYANFHNKMLGEKEKI